jgi:hypothetical protein
MLRSSIIWQWAALYTDYVRRACPPYRRRLEQVVAAGGAYIAQSLGQLPKHTHLPLFRSARTEI